MNSVKHPESFSVDPALYFSSAVVKDKSGIADSASNRTQNHRSTISWNVSAIPLYTVAASSICRICNKHRYDSDAVYAYRSRMPVHRLSAREKHVKYCLSSNFRGQRKARNVSLWSATAALAVSTPERCAYLASVTNWFVARYPSKRCPVQRRSGWSTNIHF